MVQPAMATCTAVCQLIPDLFQNPTNVHLLEAKRSKHPSVSSARRELSRSLGGWSGMGVIPYTEEDLNLNVRRALKELRQDLMAPPEQHAAKAANTESKGPTICAKPEPTEVLSKTPVPVATPNQFVVDCVNGRVRVTAIPVCHANVEANGKAHEPPQPEPSLSMGVSVKTPALNHTAEFITAFSRSPSSVLASSYASCSSTTDGESEILNLSGIDMGSVATWAQSPRDSCAPHPRFYFVDGTLELQVEDSLYKIHRHFFEHYSSFFVAIFTTLRADLTDASSSSVADSAFQICSPIQLPDITTIEFDRLLSIIYPNSFAFCDITSVEEWISILGLSCKLEFSTIRDLAIHNIAPKASIIDKALLGKRYAIKSWIMDAYTELCTRERPLSIEEGRRLGVDLVIKINELRHELFYRTGAGVSYKSSLEIGVDPLGISGFCSRSEATSMGNTREFEELPERIIQHFKLHVMDDGVPEDEGIYFKMVLDANQ